MRIVNHRTSKLQRQFLKRRKHGMKVVKRRSLKE